MKKLLLATTMAIMAALSAHPFTVDGVTYSTSDGVATVTGASNKAITKLTIPATVTYRGTTYPVNFMEGNAFWNCTSLRELVIEDSDNYIGTNFVTQTSGTSTFAELGDPFRDSPLEKIYVGRNLANRLGNGNLQAPTPISSTAPSVDLTIAGKATFIPQGISGNMNMTFINRTNITSLTIGGNVENVYNKAFSGCTGLKKVTLLPGENSISFESNTVFADCNLDSVIVKRNLTETLHGFGGAKLNTLVISPEVEKLDYTFVGYHNSLQNLVIQDSPKDLILSMSPFNSCHIDFLYFGRKCIEEHQPLLSGVKVNNVIFGPEFTEIPEYCQSHLELESAEFLGEVTKILPDAFSSCKGLQKIELPSTLKEIGSSAFSDCINLQQANLPDGIEEIEYLAFCGTNISEVTLPPSLKSINRAYSHSALKKVIITDGDTDLTLIMSPFGECDLESIYIGRNCIEQNARFIPKVKHVIFGSKIINIADWCQYNEKIESVEFLGNVEKIAPQAFESCTSLKTINLPESVNEIGHNAFWKCESLHSVNIPASLKVLDSGIFNETGLEQIVIPPTVETIRSSFNSCKNLSKVTIADSEDNIAFEMTPFYNCNLDSIYIGRNWTNQNSHIFNNTAAKHIVLGDNVTTVSEYFCYGNNILESITLSKNLKTINKSAFEYNTTLNNIISKATTPPAFVQLAYNFDDTVYDSAVLTVPAGSKKAYRAAEVWKLFKNIQSEGGGFKVTVTCDSSLGEVALNGSNVAEITVDEDEPLSIAITPIEGYKVAKMTVNGTDVTGSLVDNAIAYESIDSNMDIVVEFDIITFAVNLPAGLTGGRIIINNLETAPATVDYGSRLEIAAVADRGYELTALSVNGTDVIESLDENGAYVIESVTADINVEAAFEPITYTVTAVNLTDYGTLTLNGEAGDCKVAFGQPLVIGVMPRDEGCYLVSLTVDGTDVTAGVTGGTYTVETVEADMTVEAVFGFYTYTVQLGYDPAMGTIIPDQPGGDSEVTVAHGTTLRLTILPAEGYEIATVTLDGDDVTGRVDDNGVLTLENVTAPHRVEATFEIKRVRLSVLGLQGGQLAMRYDYGTEVTLLVEPEDGWEFHSLTVGDTTVTELEPDGSYTTPALTDDTAVSVVFKLAGQSGADSPAEARMITVATRGTTVIVTGARDGEQVEVFDTAGVAVYRGTEHEIDLNRQGIHIVRVAGLTFKVMLK